MTDLSKYRIFKLQHNTKDLWLFKKYYRILQN